jgi:hypothetical protein
MGHSLDGRKIPIINRFVRESVKKAAHFFLVRRFNGPEPDLHSALEAMLEVDLRRIEVGGFRQENLIRIKDLFFFCLMYKV